MAAFLDAPWYLERYPDLMEAKADPLEHFLSSGLSEGRQPNAFFDPDWYVREHPDVALAGANPVLHYLSTGISEERRPHPSFDLAFYLDAHPEASPNPVLFHLKVGAARGWRTSPEFDVTRFLPSRQTRPEVPSECRVSVIIPVYRGLAETRRCLATVLRDGNRPPGRILVIDDSSPEPELSAWLSEAAKKGEFELLRNATNIGFVASVNRGMAACGTDDVVLLNSDTEVPEGWLHRMAAHAYVGDDIGTVTPFSNNATICSYPSPAGGPLAFGRTLAEIDAACAEANSGRAIDIPTAVGFAMYIRRRCLDEVGAFDVERFGLGYGEENDFCLRASALGWRHRLACDVFVYHAGEVSFGKNSPSRDRAWTALVERHPDYPRLVSRFVQRAPAAPARFAATGGLFHAGGRPVILLVCHSLGGGTERHVGSLVAAAAGQADFVILRPWPSGVALSFPAEPSHPELMVAVEPLDDLVTLLQSLGVTRLHIHHWFGLRMNLRELIHRLGVPVDVTVHDYFAICPQVNLLSALTGAYCGEPAPDVCNACIAAKPSHGAHDIIAWRLNWRWLFAEAERIICPSEDVRARLARFGIEERVAVVPHEPVAAGPWPLAIPAIRADEALRVGILGHLAPHKGARIVAECVKLSARQPLEFVLIGTTVPPLPFSASAPFRETGPYKDADLPGLLAEIAPHCLLFPTPSPETYSYTLTTALTAGLPIVASDIGAFPERLQGRPWTWLVPLSAPAATWLAILEEVRLAIATPRVDTTAAMRPEIAAFYPTDYLKPSGDPRPVARPPVIRDIRDRRRPTIVAVPEVMSTGSFSPCAYIRLLLPFDHLAASGHVDLTVASPEEALRYRPDIIACHRHAPSDQGKARRLIDHCRRHEISLVYDLDDNLLDIPDAHPEATYLRDRALAVRDLTRAADVVWASTDPLREVIAAYNERVGLLPNALDERLWGTGPSRLRGGASEDVRILYMGTATHADDLDFVMPALEQLLARYSGRLSIDIIGITPARSLPGGLKRVALPDIATRSYPAFVRWIRDQEPWDIGIAPLLDSTFNRSKSAIKALDYAALGMAVVASDVAPYRVLPEAVPRPENTRDAWVAALDGLIADPVRRRRLAEANLRHYRRTATLAASTATRMDAIQTCLPASTRLAAEAARTSTGRSIRSSAAINGHTHL